MTIAGAYLDDAKSQLSLAAALIDTESTPLLQWQATLFAAIGIEKLLKYGLANRNPALVLRNPGYESIVVTCHFEQITAHERIADLKKKADEDVVSLKTAVQRAALFSDAVKKHSPFIHALADLRDVAAHRPWSEAELGRAKTILCRDLYPAILDISQCMTLEPSDLLRGHVGRLEQLSEQISTEENVAAQMRSLLALHKAKWLERSIKPDLVKGAEKVTYARLSSEPYVSCVQCPACGNDSVATLEPDIDYDFDPVDETAYATVVGVSVDNVKCFYCSLLLDKYDQLRYVNADALVS